MVVALKLKIILTQIKVHDDVRLQSALRQRKLKLKKQNSGTEIKIQEMGMKR